MSENELGNLNPAQKQVVLTTEGPVLVLAGAGAGKTKTIVERIKHLVRKGVGPSEILAITFTNKAAREMRERIEKGLSEDPAISRPVSNFERPFVSTFHALGVHILREQAEKIGLRKQFVIFDRDDSKKVIKEILNTLGLDPKSHEPGKLIAIISKEKGAGVKVSEYVGREGKGYLARVISQVWPEYEKELKKNHALDFDDLLVRTCELLNDNLEIRNHYQSIWKYIHVDEYQDTNRIQYEISKNLAGRAMNICVVGDVDQNIYSWRGADIKNILDFEKDYPSAQVFILEENYRSTKTILEAANTVIEKNKIRRKKNLFTSNAGGDKIGLFQSFDEAREAEFIADKASQMIKDGTPEDEIAVLYRANFQSRVLEEAFMRQNIPYQMLGTRFFERKEVKDVTSYLRGALNPDSLSDLKRIINVPVRGIGKTTILKIFSGMESDLPSKMQVKLNDFRNLLVEIEKFAKENKPSETIRYIIKRSGLEDEWKSGGDEGLTRFENASELSNFASKYDELEPQTGILNFLSDAALQSDQDEMDENNKAVRLMTIHSSKGLEFDTVFIAGLEEGLFPHQGMDDGNKKPEESEEERRLFYVALTRARKKIYLSYAETRMVFGSRQVSIPSRFIFEIPENLIETEDYGGDNIYRRPLLEIDF